MNLLKTLTFTVVVPATITVYVRLWLVLSPRAFVRADAAHLIGLPPIIFGACVYLRCAWDFATRERGTPAPTDPPKELVARGLYRRVRNPVCVGVAALLFGESLLFASAALPGTRSRSSSASASSCCSTRSRRCAASSARHTSATARPCRAGCRACA